MNPSIATHLVQDSLSHRKEKNHPLPDLTARQRDVLQRIAEGCWTKDIANTLKLSVKTVDTHRSDLMRRLAIHDVAGPEKSYRESFLTHAPLGSVPLV